MGGGVARGGWGYVGGCTWGGGGGLRGEKGYILASSKLLHIGRPLEERVRLSFAENFKKWSHYLQNLINFHGFYVQKTIHNIEILESIIMDYNGFFFRKHSIKMD